MKRERQGGSIKRYIGTRTDAGVTVTVLDAEGGEEPLDPRYDLRNHSPDGFNFGYGGSGPAQLALALLADALGNDEQALKFYQDFKFQVIGRLDNDEFEMTQDDIHHQVVALEAKRGNRR